MEYILPFYMQCNRQGIDYHKTDTKFPNTVPMLSWIINYYTMLVRIRLTWLEKEPPNTDEEHSCSLANI